MTQICVTTEVETWQSEGPSEAFLKGESYSFRGSTGGRVTNVIAFIEREASDYYGESAGKDIPGVKSGDTVYAVVADYSSGDTFGEDGGHSQVLDFFLDPDEADELLILASAESTSDNFSDRYTFQYKGKEYSRAWVGYFESLNDLEVWACTVRPDRWTEGPRPGYRRGR
jgi:hypothetical protein